MMPNHPVPWPSFPLFGTAWAAIIQDKQVSCPPPDPLHNKNTPMALVRLTCPALHDWIPQHREAQSTQAEVCTVLARIVVGGAQEPGRP